MSVGLLYSDDIDVMVDVRESDSHELSSEITENTLETGSKISDHTIQKPRRLTVVFNQTNTGDGNTRARNVWDKLKYIWENRSPLTVLTFHENYFNMQIENLIGLHSAPFKGAMKFTLALKQINSVSLQYVAIPESQLLKDDKSTNKAASTEVPAGTLSTKPVPESYLHKADN
jgi:hypothetical protein